MDTLPPDAERERSLRRAWAGALVLAVLVVLAPLAAPGLSDARETHLGADARDTLRTGQWLVVWDREAPRLKKPPLARWLVAASFAVGAPGAFWLRLPGALCVLGAVLLTAAMARRAAGRAAGILAAVLLVTTTQALVQFWVASAEQVLTLTTTAALYAAWRALEAGVGARARAAFLLLAGLALGVGMLAKGPVAPALVLFSLLGFLLTDAPRRAWRTLLHPALWAGLAVVLLPWLLALLARYPEAPRVWRSEATQHAALGSDFHTPMAFKWFVLAAPWVPLAVAGLFASWHPAARVPVAEGGVDRRAARFVLWWLLGNLVTFAVVVPSRSHYFTPVLPGVALLAALGLVCARLPGARGEPARGVRVAALALQPLGLVLAYVGLPAGLWLLARHLEVRWPLAVAGAVLGLLGVAALARAWRRRDAGAASVLACAAPLGLATALFGLLAYPAEIEPGSFRPLAEFAAEAAHGSGRTLYRLEDRLANTPIGERFRLSRELDFYLEPPPRSFGAIEGLAGRLQPGQPVLMLLTAGQLEQVQALAGVRARPLGPRARDGGRHGLLAEVERAP